jgi:hypothetical protein
MSVVVLVLLALLALVARSLVVLHRRAGWERLWRFGAGPCTVELLRHVELSRFDHDSQAFPQPRETRLLSLRLAGIPLWSQYAIVGLPGDADGRLDSIPADEFDHLFVGEFKRQWQARRRVPASLLAGRH